MYNRFLERLEGILEPSTVEDGRVVVLIAGTRVQLPDQKCSYVIIQAETNNTGNIAVGGSTVVAAAATARGAILETSRSEKFYVTNLNRLFIDATISGDGVTFVLFK